MNLWAYAGRRVLQLIPLLVVISFVTFVALALAPGDPVQIMLGPDATPQAAAQLRAQLGLNQSLLVQYAHFLWNALRGNLGSSYYSGRSVMGELGQTVGVSGTLALTAMILAVAVGVGLGILSAVRQDSITDNLVRVFVLVLVSMPVFWLGILMIFSFAVKLPLLPAFGWGSLADVVLPAVSLGVYPLAVICRMTRSAMLEVLRSDYIRTVRAAGIPEHSVVLRYALKNALGPVITVIGLQFGALIGGAVLTETIFGIPGVGQLTVNAIGERDYPVVRGAILLGTVVFVVVNIAVDMLNMWINPRQRGA